MPDSLAEGVAYASGMGALSHTSLIGASSAVPVLDLLTCRLIAVGQQRGDGSRPCGSQSAWAESGGIAGQRAAELVARAEVELGEDLAQVALDRPRADEQPRTDLRV